MPLRFNDASSWQALKTLKGGYAAFTSDGKMLVLENSKDKSITLYDTATWQTVSMADSQLLLKNGRLKIVSPATVTLYDTTTWKETKTFAGGYGFFSQDGRMLVVINWNYRFTILRS